jgi:hypothetical protein
MYSNDGFGQVVQVVLEEPASYRARSLDCVLAVAAAVLDFASSGLPSSWLPAAAIDAISNREQIKKRYSYIFFMLYIPKQSFF